MTITDSLPSDLSLSLFISLSVFLIRNDAFKIMVGCRSCTYASIHLFMALTLKITVGCPSCTDTSFRAEKNLHTCVELLGPCLVTTTMKEPKKCFLELGIGGQDVCTWAWAGRMRQQRGTLRWGAWQFLRRLNTVQRRTPGAMRCTALSWTSEVRMSEWEACRSARVHRHRHAVECRLCHYLTLLPWPILADPPQSGTGVMCLAKSSSRAWRAAASSTASWKSSSLWARNWHHPVLQTWFLSHRSLTAWAAHSVEDWRRAVEYCAGERVGCLRLDAALEAAEDCQVARVQGRSAVRRDEDSIARREGTAAIMAARVVSLLWMLAMSQRRIYACPCMPGFTTSSRAVVSCKIVLVEAQPFSDVTSWICSGQTFCWRARSAPACRAGHSPCWRRPRMSSWRRSALTACWSIRQHFLTNSWCVLACCCSRLRSSFMHLAGFL